MLTNDEILSRAKIFLARHWGVSEERFDEAIREHCQPDAYWTDKEGNRDDKSEYSLYCSGCKQWSEYRGNYCINCGRKMINPEAEW